MTYRIGEIAALAHDLGFEISQLTACRIDVLVGDGCVLIFLNENERDDDLVGFEGMQWHSHGTVTFLTGDGAYIECDELDLLIGLSTGELIIVTAMAGGTTRDRWIVHKNEPLELKHIQMGDELRICTSGPAAARAAMTKG